MARQYEGIWIPAAVWEDDRLNAIEKILVAEVASFTSRGAEFYKTNETIADHLKISASTVKRSLANLIDLGYVKRERFDGRRRILSAQIDPADRSERPGRKVKMTRQPAQNKPAAGSNRPKSKTESKPKNNTKQIKTAWPWPESQDVWTAWLEYRRLEHRFHYKSEHSARAAIDKLVTLSNHNEQQAREIVRQSIANGWRGFFPLDNRTRRAPTTEDRDQFARYIQTGTF